MSVVVHTVTNLDRDNANGQMPALRHRAWQNAIIPDGTFGALSCSANGNTVVIGSCWGIAKGAIFTITQEAITVGDTAGTGETVNGRIKLKIDTSTSTAQLIREEVPNGGTLPALQTTNITAADGIYEMALCTYVATLSSVSSVTRVAPYFGTLDSKFALKQDQITGAASTVTANNLTTNRVVISNSSGKLAASGINTTKLGYLSNVTRDIQAQLDEKQGTITGAISDIVSSNLTPTMVVITNPNGKIQASSGITVTELSYLNNVTSNIQTQIDNANADIATKLELKKINSGYGNIGQLLTSVWSSLATDVFLYSAIIDKETSPRYYIVIGRKISATTGIALAIPASLTTFDDGTGTSVANIEYWRLSSSTWTRYDFFDSDFGLYLMDNGEINTRVIAKNENSTGYRVRNINVVNANGNNVNTNNILFMRS